jgi:membrane protease YdiL (CAAX protease family)
VTAPGPPAGIVRGSDVLRALLSIVGLGLGLFVTALFAHSVMVVFGYRGATILTLPVLLALETAAVLGGVYFSLVRTRRLTWEDLGWARVSPGWIVIGALSSLAIFAAMIAIQMVLATVAGELRIGVLPPMFDAFPLSLPGFLASLLFGAVTVPIAEEFFFRGLLFRWINDRWGFVPGAGVSALVFAVAHPPAAGSAPMIFLIGIALAYLYERSGSLWPSIALHMVNNAIGITFIYLTLWLGPGAAPS